MQRPGRGRTQVTGCAISSAFASTPCTSACTLSCGMRTQGSSAAIASAFCRAPGRAAVHASTIPSTASSDCTCPQRRRARP
jgi:hypothetical protein